jgi:hypothetical protein
MKLTPEQILSIQLAQEKMRSASLELEVIKARLGLKNGDSVRPDGTVDSAEDAREVA